MKNFIQPLRGFLQDVQKQYHQVPYHNHVHAADVLSSSAYFLREERRLRCVRRKALSDLRTAGWVDSPLAPFQGSRPLWPPGPPCIFALEDGLEAVIHDVGHFGRPPGALKRVGSCF